MTTLPVNPLTLTLSPKGARESGSHTIPLAPSGERVGVRGQPEHGSKCCTASDKKRFLIVDGHSYAYRAFHAIRQLSAPDGRPTNAIYGFIKMLAKLRGRFEPNY